MGQTVRFVVIGCAALVHAAHLVAQEPYSPLHIFITYRAEPAQRIAFREAAETRLASRLEAWQQDGMYADYMLLYNTYSDVDTWDLLLVLRFDDHAQVARWKRIEREAPGGLSPELLRLGSPRHTHLASRVWDRAAPDRDPSCAVFFVFPYQHYDVAVYRQFAETYVVPQFDAWLDEGVLARYSLFLNRHATGNRWGVLSLLEYADHIRFGQRDDIKQEIRAGLAASPAWTLAGDIKSQFRQGRQAVIAEPIGPKAASCPRR